MERKYNQIPWEGIDFAFLKQFKSFYFYFSNMGNKVHFPVKGYKKVGNDKFITILKIPNRLSPSIYNNFPNEFYAFSLIRDFDANTGKPYKKLVRVYFENQGVQDHYLLLLPKSFWYSLTNRKLERILNITDDLYANQFMVDTHNIDTKCRILNFNVRGAKLEIMDNKLLNYIQQTDKFQFKLCFPFGDYNIGVFARVLNTNKRRNGATDIGVIFEDYVHLRDREGGSVDGKKILAKAIQRYKKEYLQDL